MKKFFTIFLSILLLISAFPTQMQAVGDENIEETSSQPINDDSNNLPSSNQKTTDVTVDSLMIRKKGEGERLVLREIPN